MKTTHRASVFLATCALALTVGSMSGAATCQFGTAAEFSQTADVTSTIACAGEIAGNDSVTSNNGANVNVNLFVDPGYAPDAGFFGISNWVLDSRYDSSGAGSYDPDGILQISEISQDLMEGFWSVSSWEGVTSAMLVLKGSNQFAAYLINLSAGLGGEWITQALSNGGENQPAVSHISLYISPAAVPLPAAGFLMIGALGGLAALRRRRRVA